MPRIARATMPPTCFLVRPIDDRLPFQPVGFVAGVGIANCLQECDPLRWLGRSLGVVEVDHAATLLPTSITGRTAVSDSHPRPAKPSALSRGCNLALSLVRVLCSSGADRNPGAPGFHLSSVRSSIGSTVKSQVAPAARARCTSSWGPVEARPARLSRDDWHRS